MKPINPTLLPEIEQCLSETSEGVPKDMAREFLLSYCAKYPDDKDILVYEDREDGDVEIMWSGGSNSGAIRYTDKGMMSWYASGDKGYVKGSTSRRDLAVKFGWLVASVATDQAAGPQEAI